LAEVEPTDCRPLEIAEAIERLSPRAEADLRELYRRIVFSILTGNTDDHLRNHAFLRVSGGWALSPAYDLNPNPDNPARLSTAIDLDDTTANIDLALSVSGYFRLTPAAASQADRMAVAYESDQRRTARSLSIS
jgi:serine/threonine-protein kinase HipA